MKILALDLSFAKTGIAVLSFKDGKPTIESAYLFKSDAKASQSQRIYETVLEIEYVINLVKPDYIVKEASIVARQSTATPVLKTHGALEYRFKDVEIHEVHNASIKAYARKIIGKQRADHLKKDEPKKWGKLVVKEAVEKIYGEVLEMYTPKGAYLDDVGDAILLGTLWLSLNGHIHEIKGSG